MVNIVPFSIDTASEGSPSLFHEAICASSERIFTGFTSGVIGILLSMKYFSNSPWIMCLRFFLLKGPVYEMNAEAIKTSPVTSFCSRLMFTMALAQRSFSDPSAETRRCARSRRVLHRSASFSAASFSAIAELYSSISFYSEAFSSATIFCTASSLTVADSSCSVASPRAFLLGSTY